MRFTIEPTNEGINEFRDCQNSTVVIQTQSDDLSILDIGRVVSAALIAYGYHPENVRDLINTEVE